MLSICVLKFVINFVYDTPGGLEETIIQVMKVDSTQYTLLYSVYSWPAIVTALLSGVIIDRFLGLGTGIVIVVVLATVGQIIIALGCFINTYWLMLLGRFVLGIGAEAAVLAASAFTALWFKGKWLAFVFAIITSFNRLGGAAGLLLNGPLYESFGYIKKSGLSRLGMVFLVGVALCVLCVITSIMAAILEKRAESLLNRSKKRGVKCFFKDCKSFGIKYWLIAISATFYFGVFFPFVAVGQVFYISKFNLSTNLANVANMLSYVIPIVVSPIFGLMIDWIGFHEHWELASFILYIGSHILVVLSDSSVYIPFIVTVINGVSYSIFNTAVNVTISMLVENHQLSIAFGFLTACFNIGYSIVVLVSGAVIDRSGYLILEIFLISLLTLGVVFLIFYIYFTNYKANISGKIWKYKLKKRQERFSYSIQNSDHEHEEIRLFDL